MKPVNAPIAKKLCQFLILSDYNFQLIERSKFISSNQTTEPVKCEFSHHFIGSFSMPKTNSISAFSEKYSKTPKEALTSTYPAIYNKIPFSGSYN